MPVLTIPPSSPYNGAYISNAEAGDCPPGNGRHSAPFYLDWSAVSAQAPTIEINFQNSIGMPSQIAALYVDNGRSHQGVYFIFPDTSFRLIVPPFVRGIYPVLTNTKRFFAGIFAPASGTNDHTVVHALDWLPSAFEGSALLLPVQSVVGFDPAAGQVAVPLITNPSSAWLRLRELNVNFSGLVANGAIGLVARFELLADTVVVGRWGMHLLPAESVDANTLVSLQSQDIAAITWAFNWTIASGSVTTDGATSGIVNIYTDVAEPN